MPIFKLYANNKGERYIVSDGRRRYLNNMKKQPHIEYIDGHEMAYIPHIKPRTAPRKHKKISNTKVEYNNNFIKRVPSINNVNKSINLPYAIKSRSPINSERKQFASKQPLQLRYAIKSRSPTKHYRVNNRNRNRIQKRKRKESNKHLKEIKKVIKRGEKQWKHDKPRTAKEIGLVYNRCGDRCFIQNKPICKRCMNEVCECNYDCNGLMHTKREAARRGDNYMESIAFALAKDMNCPWIHIDKEENPIEHGILLNKSKSILKKLYYD